MAQNRTSIYIPIELHDKLHRLKTRLEEILGKSIALYEVIEILIALQVKDELE